MATEIERKFLVTGDDWMSAEPIYYCQGYLNRDKNRTVRVRIAGNSGFLTIKGLTVGASRPEFEYEVPASDAEQMLKLCDSRLVEKNRRVIQIDGATWEIDEFLGENSGLVVAEIELESEDQEFTRPEWLGAEVTDDARYYNSRLASHPFSLWNDDLNED